MFLWTTQPQKEGHTHTPQGIDHTGPGVSLALADCGFLWSSLFRAQLAVPMGSLCQGILALIQVPITTNTTTVHRVFQCYRSKGPSGNRLQKEGWIPSQWFLFIHPASQPAMSVIPQAAAPPKAWFLLRGSSYFSGKWMDFTQISNKSFKSRVLSWRQLEGAKSPLRSWPLKWSLTAISLFMNTLVN